MVEQNYLLNLRTAKRAGEQQWQLLAMGLLRTKRCLASQVPSKLPSSLVSSAALKCSAILNLVSWHSRERNEKNWCWVLRLSESQAAVHFISDEVSLFLLCGHFTSSLISGNTSRTLPSLMFPDASDHISTNPAMSSPTVWEIACQKTLVTLVFNLMTSCTGHVSFWSWGEATDWCCGWGQITPCEPALQGTYTSGHVAPSVHPLCTDTL